MMFAALQFGSAWPAWIWIVLIPAAIGSLFLTYDKLARRADPRQIWPLLGLRIAGVAALLLALAKPDWIDRRVAINPGRAALIVDNSASMSLAGPPGASRFQAARRAATAIQDRLESAAGPRMKAVFFDIDGLALPRGLPAEPRVERTDLRRALDQSIRELRTEPLAALVLISDGVDNTGTPDPLAGYESPAPIYALTFRPDADTNRIDLAVTRVTAPRRCLVHNTIKVEARIAKSGGPPATAKALVRRGQEILASTPVALGPGQVDQQVTLTIKPDEAGRFALAAAVESDAGEKITANNTRFFQLQVDADAIRVLYLEGFLRYEYKFLKNRFEDDPDVSLVSVIRRANPELEVKSDGEVLDAARLENFDVVILGDMESDYLAPAEYGALTAWLDAGHALLVLGGYRSFGPAGFRNSPLAPVLPVIFAEREPFQSEAPFVISLTEEGRRHPAFEITGDRVRDAAQWQASPSLLGCAIVARAKPGAEILAVHPDLRIDNRPLPLALAQRYGAGRVMVLAFDTTWRWSRLTRVLGLNDTLFARFWSQTTRWLAGRDVRAAEPGLTVTTDRPDYERGQPVLIAVKPSSSVTNTVGAAPSVAVVADSGQAVAVALQPGTNAAAGFTGEFRPRESGRHEVQARMIVDGKTMANQAAEFIVHGSDVELADTSTDRRTLEALAAASGGMARDISDWQSIADSIPRNEERLDSVRRIQLWSSHWLFLFFVAALTTEWFMRRRNRLI